jgi:hypothetical protein
MLNQNKCLPIKNNLIVGATLVVALFRANMFFSRKDVLFIRATTRDCPYTSITVLF